MVMQTGVPVLYAPVFPSAAADSIFIPISSCPGLTRVSTRFSGDNATGLKHRTSITGARAAAGTWMAGPILGLDPRTGHDGWGTESGRVQLPEVGKRVGG